MKVVFDESGFLMKLTTFVLILMNPYPTESSVERGQLTNPQPTSRAGDGEDGGGEPPRLGINACKPDRCLWPSHVTHPLLVTCPPG